MINSVEKIKKRSISSFLNKEVYDYSLHIVENRALPSVIDGFRPTNRKIIYVASTNKIEWLKIFQLTGTVAKDAFYHHGDASMNSAITNMGQDFKNNITLFDRKGQFGTLRSTEAGAPRYIEVRLSKIFQDIFKDSELLESQYEEGNKIEPKFYLPIIPMVLINQTDGIATGFVSRMLTRCPISVLECCANYLINDNFNHKPRPHINGFSGTFTIDPENNKRWIIRGTFKRNKNTVLITDLPPSMTYSKYDDILSKLSDEKKIVSFKDSTSNNIISIQIKLSNDVSNSLTDEDLYKYLRLEEYFTDEFNTIDENGKLKQFDQDIDIVKYFVDFRLTYYQKRKDYEIAKIKEEIQLLGNRGVFIKNVLDGTIEIKQTTKAKLISDITDLKLAEINNSYDYLTSIPIYNITKDYLDIIREQFQNKKNELKNKELEDTKVNYINELRELNKKLKKLL
jgi:DNA topoisomerase-2